MCCCSQHPRLTGCDQLPPAAGCLCLLQHFRPGSCATCVVIVTLGNVGDVGSERSCVRGLKSDGDAPPAPRRTCRARPDVLPAVRCSPPHSSLIRPPLLARSSLQQRPKSRAIQITLKELGVSLSQQKHATVRARRWRHAQRGLGAPAGRRKRPQPPSAPTAPGAGPQVAVVPTGKLQMKALDRLLSRRGSCAAGRATARVGRCRCVVRVRCTPPHAVPDRSCARATFASPAHSSPPPPFQMWRPPARSARSG